MCVYVCVCVCVCLYVYVCVCVCVRLVPLQLHPEELCVLNDLRLCGVVVRVEFLLQHHAVRPALKYGENILSEFGYVPSPTLKDHEKLFVRIQLWSNLGEAQYLITVAAARLLALDLIPPPRLPMLPRLPLRPMEPMPPPKPPMAPKPDCCASDRGILLL
jgi:hypothetical protein